MGTRRDATAPARGQAGETVPLVDPATSLPTVAMLLGRMQEILATAGSIGVITVHIVQERRLAQALGWQAFDQMLRDVASFLRDGRTRPLRREDHVAEMMVSGNAFVIALSPPRSGQRLSRENLERARDRVRGALRDFLAGRLPVTGAEGFRLQVGCALVEDDPSRRRERLIYQALEDSLRDAVKVAESERSAGRRALRKVLEAREVRSVYQPVVDTRRWQIVGYEALSRVPPERFRTVEEMFVTAQKTELLWELERLCRRQSLGSLGAFPQGQMLFLNIEPDSVYDPDFRGPSTLALLEEAGLRPSQVVLEMTEHSAVRDFRSFRAALAQFRALGFRLAIDDVGSGYSGLQSIAEVRPEFIKIDMTLVRDVHRDAIKRDLLQTVARFCRGARIAVIAEGVEERAEMQTLREIGIGLAQGYFFARPGHPLPEPALAELRQAAGGGRSRRK